jgi:hypothetical protein
MSGDSTMPMLREAPGWSLASNHVTSRSVHLRTASITQSYSYRNERDNPTICYARPFRDIVVLTRLRGIQLERRPAIFSYGLHEMGVVHRRHSEAAAAVPEVLNEALECSSISFTHSHDWIQPDRRNTNV